MPLIVPSEAAKLIQQRQELRHIPTNVQGVEDAGHNHEGLEESFAKFAQVSNGEYEEGKTNTDGVHLDEGDNRQGVEAMQAILPRLAIEVGQTNQANVMH